MIRRRQNRATAGLGLWRQAVVALGLACAVAATPAAAQDPVGRTELAPAAISAPALEPGAEIVVSALDNVKRLPAAAYNPKHDEYLVVWHNQWGGGYRDIYAQRVTAAGQLKSWFAVTAGAPNSRAQPSVAYDPVNDRYLVVWIYDVFGNGTDWDIHGRFIPWNGPDNALGEFVICDWGSSQWNPDVVYAAAQKEFFVVWTNTPASVPAYISGRRIFANGGFPDNKGFTIASHPSQQRVNPDVTYNLARNEYLVVYDDVFDIFGARVSGTGVLLAGGEFGIAGWPDQEYQPAAAACADVDQYLVLWQSKTAADKHEIYGRFLTGAGAPQTVVHLQQTPNEEKSPKIVCDSTARNYLALWQQEVGLGGVTLGWAIRRVHANGDMGGVWGFIGVADLSAPALTAGEVNFLAFWEQKRSGSAFQDIYACLIHMERLFVPALIK